MAFKWFQQEGKNYSLKINDTEEQICIHFYILFFFQMVKNAMAAAAVRCYNSAAAEPFANGTTASYVEEMYNNWLRDPSSVHTVSFL